jgi:hypothetical protein
MGGKSGACQKEEWTDQIMCRLQKSKQGVSQGQLPTA